MNKRPDFKEQNPNAARIEKTLKQGTDFSDTAVESFARELAKVNNQELDPKVKVAKNLVEKLEKFGEVGEKASMFEMAMAVMGAASSGFQADWIAYFLESFGELAENVFVSGRELPGYIKTPMKALATIFRIKKEDGSALKSSDDFVEAQESLIGAINTTLSSASLANIAFRTIPKVLRGEEAPENNESSFHQVTTKILPVINAVLMWASGAGKRHITHAINEIHQNGYKAKTDGAWTSGMQDYYCGSNSLALMLRQGISLINPKLAQLAEPLFGAWISGSSFKEGLRALRNDEPDADYKLHAIDTSIFGKTFYGVARMLTKPFGVDLPAYSKLKAGIREPSVLLGSRD